MNTAKLSPIAFAVHTRDEEEDYRWLQPQGEMRLLDRMKLLHKNVISDMGRGKPATFCLFEDYDRLGILVSNLETTRVDHSRTRVNDTLFLEFAHQDRYNVYRLCVGLLGKHSAAIQANLVEYAETAFEALSRSKPIEVAPLAFGGPELSDSQEGDFVSSATALHATDDAIADASRHLSFLAKEDGGRSRSFCFVFAGLTGVGKLAVASDSFDSFLALSRSTSIDLDEQTDLRSLTEKKKRSVPFSNVRPVHRLPVYWVGLLALSALALVPWAIYRQTTSSGSNPELPNSNQKTSDSIEKTTSLNPSQTASSNNFELVEAIRSNDAEIFSLSLTGDGRLADGSTNERRSPVEKFTIKPDQPFVASIDAANNGQVRLEFEIDIEPETDMKLVVGNKANAGVVLEIASQQRDKQAIVVVSVARPGDNSPNVSTFSVQANIDAGQPTQLVLLTSDEGITMQVGSEIIQRDGDYSIGDDTKLEFAVSRGRASVSGLQVAMGRPNVTHEGGDED